MIRNIITLTLNDLAIAIKNKTIFLVFFIPLFVFLTLNLVDSKSDKLEVINIGIIESETYSPLVMQSLASAKNIFNINYIENVEVGKQRIKEKKLDAILLNTEQLIVLKKESIRTLAVIESFQALQRSAEGKNSSWIKSVQPLLETDIQKQSLPTWILMLVLLVSFIIMPSQVAEEKEKRLLLALLQTPMREIEWLLAKVLLSMILIFTSIYLLHVLGKMNLGFNFSYLAFIAVASFCFSSYGVLLGFLCRSQASARTIGVIFYLPHLLPSALSDFSKKINIVAPFVPSYQFYEPIKAILFEQKQITSFGFEWIYLLTIGVLTFFISYVLIRKRWLM